MEDTMCKRDIRRRQSWMERERMTENGVIIMVVVLVVSMVLILVFSGTAKANDHLQMDASKDVAGKWTIGDSALEAVFLASLAVDRGQTNGAQDMGRKEIGWARHFIGEDPSSGQVNRYFAACAALHAAVAYALPKPYRTVWQSFWIGVEFKTIDSNVSAGIGMRF